MAISHDIGALAFSIWTAICHDKYKHVDMLTKSSACDHRALTDD